MTLLTRQEISDYQSLMDLVGDEERDKIKQLLEFDKVERCKESFIFFA